MYTKDELRRILRERLPETVGKINAAFQGENLDIIEPVLTRIGRGRQLPHWYKKLQQESTLPNLDGKTIGSVVEMILVGVLESSTLSGLGLPPLRINPARGVDLPDLDLGVKSPSENFCTSEPFFSAYERLLGSEYDVLVLLTDYQIAKKTPPLRLQITKWKYLTKSQIADEGLCRIARKHREWLQMENESWAKKMLKFLAYINQSDWRAKRLLKIIDLMKEEGQVQKEIEQAKVNFEVMNRKRIQKNQLPIPDSDLEALARILDVQPLHLGVIDAADNWVVEVQKDMGRLPNDNEWQRFLSSPLDGLIGMSFALQWRFNFSRLFGIREEEPELESLF